MLVEIKIKMDIAPAVVDTDACLNNASVWSYNFQKLKETLHKC